MGWLKDFLNAAASAGRKVAKEPILSRLRALYVEIEHAEPEQAQAMALRGLDKLLKYVEDL